MRIPTQPYLCTAYEYDDAGDPIEVEARDPAEAAVRATGQWEESLNDFRVLNAQDTLRLRVEQGGQVTYWEVGAERGRYLAKAMRTTEGA